MLAKRVAEFTTVLITAGGILTKVTGVEWLEVLAQEPVRSCEAEVRLVLIRLIFFLLAEPSKFILLGVVWTLACAVTLRRLRFQEAHELAAALFLLLAALSLLFCQILFDGFLHYCV